MNAVTAAVHIAGKKFLILDYLVPVATEAVAVGSGIICPLRGRSHNGIVLKTYESPQASGLKEFDNIISGGPIVPKELVELVFWIADTYLVGVEQAVSLIFPPFARGSWKETYKLKAKREDLAPLTALEPDTQEIVEYVLDKGEFQRSTLEARFGSDMANLVLGWLQDAGLVFKERFYREKQVRTRGNMASLLLEEPQTFIEENKRARKQVAVVESLIRHGGTCSLDALLEEADTTRAVIKILEQKQILEVYTALDTWEEDVERQINLNPDQQACLDAVTASLEAKEQNTFLLHGVTGSGKTEVYVRAAEFAVSLGKQVIVIVPEIALSTQLIRYFQRSFGRRAVVLHSKLASLERYQTWQAIGKGEVDVVIGTRSAVFAPFAQLGLIIIDEEHDRSLKQESSPRYHCIGVAEKRCRLKKGVLLLGSATPSLESYLRAQRGELVKLEMPLRIGSELPEIKVVDMREELRQGNTTIISSQVREAITERLEKGEQAIVFLNRRGYASFVSCRSCGYVFKCDHCDISLTYHAGRKQLKCHYCDFTTTLAKNCPACGSKRIKTFGLGTERVEESIRAAFPQARVLRLDSDTTSRVGAHEKIVGAFTRGEAEILIGTQMVAKGFDFPGVTLVCVIAADIDLNLPDFRAEERTFQLLTQVAGRAGRRKTRGEVLIQSYLPESPGIAYLGHKQQEFYAYELFRRQELGYPPFSRLVRFLFSGKLEGQVIQAGEQVASRLFEQKICFLGPSPAPIEKIKDLYRWHLIIRDYSTGIKELLETILEEEREAFANRVNIVVDVDPLSLM